MTDFKGQKLRPLSAKEAEMRRPPRPEALMQANHEPVYIKSIKSRIAKAIRVSGASLEKDE